jgi:hypothetical protein
VTATPARLVIALRIAYLLGAGLFVIDMVIAIVAQIVAGSDAVAGEVDSVTDWLAVAAFACAAVGAIITVAVLSLRSSPVADDSPDELH